MKSPILLVLLLLLAVVNTQAQKKVDGTFEEWGHVSPVDLAIDECAFEKNPDAIMLLDLAQVYYQDEGSSFYGSGKFKINSAYYQRYKVLTEKGVEQAVFRITYRHESKEGVAGIKGAAYNMGIDGQLIKTELEGSGIHFNKRSEYETEVTFTIPGVKAGCVFEVAYTRTQYVSYTLPAWYFNAEIPSIKSSITIGFLDPIEYFIEKYKCAEIKTETKPFDPDIKYMPQGYFTLAQNIYGTMATYTAENLHSVKDEPYMNSRKNYMKHLQFQLLAFHPPFPESPNLINSFEKLNQNLLSSAYFGVKIAGEPILKREMKALNLDALAPEDKVKAIFDFVKDNVAWNNFTGITSENSNASVWKNKTGSAADINLLLINALKNAGIKAFPMLVSPSPNGYLTMVHPVLDQFKYVVAMVELNDKKLVLDATNRYLPYNVVDNDILNTKGYLIRSVSSYDWLRITDKQGNFEKTEIKAKLDDQNNLQGTVDIAYNNYSQQLMRRLKDAGRNEVITKQLKNRLGNMNPENVRDSVDKDNYKFYHHADFTQQIVSDNDGSIYLTISDIYGNLDNPFVAKERISDVDFSYKNQRSGVIEVELPGTYFLDASVTPVTITTQDTSVVFTRTVTLKENRLIVNQTIDYKQSFYPVEDYADFYNFHQAYYKALQQPIIIKKQL